MVHTNHLGFVYGPYGGIGLIQRDGLRDVAFSFRGLLRWLLGR